VLTPLLNFTRTSGLPKLRVVGGERFPFLSGRHDPHLVLPLFPPPAQLACEGGHKNENESQREMYEKVIAVHWWYLDE
jgi:hypothetical protein